MGNMTMIEWELCTNGLIYEVVFPPRAKVVVTVCVQCGIAN